eukprot:gene1822-2138_t
MQQAYSLSSSSANVNSNSPADDNAAANRNVLSEIKRVVGEDGFIHFRQVSAQFFHEEISAEQYYVEFCRLFKKDAGAGSLWMSLVCTLPQYHLRERLYQIHYRAVREGGGFNINHAEVNILLNKPPANASDNSGGESEQSGRRAGEEADRRGGLSGSGRSRGASRGERGSEKRSMRRGRGDELQRGGAGPSRPALNEERCAGDSSAVHTAEVSRETTLHAAGLRLEMELMMSFLSSLERCVQRQLAKSYRSGGAEITSEVDPGAAETEIAQGIPSWGPDASVSQVLSTAILARLNLAPAADTEALTASFIADYKTSLASQHQEEAGRRRVDVHRSHSADITTGLLQRYSLARLKYIRSLIRALRRQAVCDPQTIPQSPSMSSTAVAQEEDSKPTWKIDLALADPLPPPPPGFEGQLSSADCSPQDLSWQAPALQDLSLTNTFPHPLDLDPPP